MLIQISAKLKTILSGACAAALALCSGTPATAGATANGTVTSVFVMAGGQVLFVTSAAASARPACAVVYTRWAFDGSTTVGQEKLALLLTAKATGAPVTVYGTDTCSVWGDTETADFFYTS